MGDAPQPVKQSCDEFGLDTDFSIATYGCVVNSSTSISRCSSGGNGMNAAVGGTGGRTSTSNTEASGDSAAGTSTTEGSSLDDYTEYMADMILEMQCLAARSGRRALAERLLVAYELARGEERTQRKSD